MRGEELQQGKSSRGRGERHRKVESESPGRFIAATTARRSLFILCGKRSHEAGRLEERSSQEDGEATGQDDVKTRPSEDKAS